jgi:hypothetical protein
MEGMEVKLETMEKEVHETREDMQHMKTAMNKMLGLLEKKQA